MEFIEDESDKEFFNYQPAQPNHPMEDFDDGISSESSDDSDYETADDESTASNNKYQRYVCESSRVVPRFNDLTLTCVALSCYVIFNDTQRKTSKYCAFCASTLSDILHIDNITSCMKHYITNARLFDETDAHCEKCKTRLWITIPRNACLVCYPRDN